MGKALAKIATLGVLLGTLGMFWGCGYGDIAVAGDKVVVTRNDMFLFGALRTVFVCKVTDGGLSACADTESP